MITRRDFLQVLAVGTGLGALGGSLAGCDDGGGGDAGMGGGDDAGMGGGVDAGTGGGEDAGMGGEDAGTGGEDAGMGGHDAGSDAGGEASCTPGTPTIEDNHGHSLTVPMADVEAGTEQTYDIQGSSGHAHTLTVTAADFTQLRETGSITVSSSRNSGHDHDVTLTCA